MTPAPSLTPCKVETCDAPTQEHLCHDCTRELKDAWDQIPPLIPVLEDISRGQDVPFYQPTAEGRGGATGSRPPMNLSAYQLAVNLRKALVYTPEEYAQHKDGAWSHAQITQWVHDADLMVNGEPEDAESKENMARYRLILKKQDLKPMTTKELITWLKDNSGITITRQNIQDWKKAGKLTAHSDKPLTYHPVEVLQAKRQDRRKM